MRQWINLTGVLSLMLYFPGAAAEIYRWTDSEGKVHYSDRKMVKDAEDVTDKVRVQNIDTSQEEQRKLQQIFRAENEADREYHRQQQEKNKPSNEQRKYCQKLRSYLNDISGRVQFIDENDQPLKITEAQRKQKVVEVEQLLRNNCSNIQ
jgi:predicted RNA-binding protein with RPS1 domain